METETYYQGKFWDHAKKDFVSWNEIVKKPKRTFTTEVRKDWQDMIAQTLKAIDRHAKYKNDDFHIRNYYILKQYLVELKSWIKAEEKKIENRKE